MNGWRITGKRSGGTCEHCGRELATRYVIANESGQDMSVGRGCLKKVTGWTVTAAQAESAIRNAARDIVWADFTRAYPDVAASIKANLSKSTGGSNEFYCEARLGNWDFARTYAV